MRASLRPFRKGAALGLALAGVVLVAASLPQLAVGGRGTSPSPATYYPYGPQLNVAESTLTTGGWVRCRGGLYGDASSVLATVLARCKGPYLLLAGGPVSSTVFDVVATAPRGDVLFDTGTGDTPHDANGSGWYFNPNWSWGFAKQGDALERDECDTNSTNAAYRLCWHTGLDDPYDRIDGGWRSGTHTGLNGSTTYRRAIFMLRLYKV